MMKTMNIHLRALCVGLALLMAMVPSAAASHNWCSNEAGDVDLILVGVDGPLLDGNGTQFCVGNDTYEVSSNVDNNGTPPSGTGVVIQICHGVGTTASECNTGAGNDVLLDWTGVMVACGSSTVTVCVWFDGQQV